MTATKPTRSSARKKPPRGADPVTRYAEAVVSGRLLTNRLVRLACERHLRDLKEGPARGLFWDVDAANRVVRFFKKVLRLNGGEHEGKEFELQPWQVFIEGSLFGWKRADTEARRFRTAYLEIAKGNGKSPLAAGTGIYMLMSDKESRAEVYAAAAKRDQAMILFRDAVAMVDQSPALAKRIVKSGANPVWNLTVPGTGSFFRPIASDDAQSGPRPHCALLDEVHEHNDATVIDLMRAGSKGRRQALFYEITNSGWDQTSVCWRHHDYSVRVLEQTEKDDEWFSFICGLDPGDDYRDEKVWRKANPNLDVSITKDYLRRQVREAEGMPAQQGVVRRLNFCEWTQLAEHWIEPEVWERNAGRVDPASLVGKRCFAGLDLSSTEDLTAYVLVFPQDDGSYDVLPHFWLPKANILRKGQQDRVTYDLWAQQGFLTLTEGNSVDQEAVKQAILRSATTYKLRDMAFDRWNSAKLITELMEEWGERGEYDEGPRVVKFGQGYADMSFPMKEVERLLLDGKIRHGGHPILSWNAANVVVKTDPAGNRKPVKGENEENRRKRIDGIVALIMAIGRAMVAPTQVTGGWFVGSVPLWED